MSYTKLSKNLHKMQSMMGRIAATPVKSVRAAIEKQMEFDQAVANLSVLTGNSTQAKLIAHGKTLEELKQINSWISQGMTLEEALEAVQE